ncbi:MAG TPA: Gfo/Idh/MocA family oxidoreductase [Acidobacteriaceae bacterium]|nr:Gfo/Idh/MocA family oxidoreductase [Acidobacteriaceae bacterium]
MPDLPSSRVVVVGAGVFGRNHLRIWQTLQDAGAPVRLVGIVEPNSAAATNLATEFRVPVYASTSQLLRSTEFPDAASIAVPTSDHASVAAELLSAGVDVLVEKPFTATLQQADELIALAQRHKRIVQVGHLERFNPAVRAVRSILHQPLFFEVHRLSVFTPRALDVDVVLDLMIHDLDIVLSWTQSPIRELHAVGLPILSSKVDIANVRIEFESGCVANFTASRVSTERVRKIRFFQPHQYVSVDYARQDVLCIDVPALQTPELQQRTSPNTSAVTFQPLETTHPIPGFAMRKLEIASGEPLRLELESFLRSVRERSSPEVTAQDGRAALVVALQISAAIRAHQSRAGLA